MQYFWMYISTWFLFSSFYKSPLQTCYQQVLRRVVCQCRHPSHSTSFWIFFSLTRVTLRSTAFCNTMFSERPGPLERQPNPKFQKWGLFYQIQLSNRLHLQVRPLSGVHPAAQQPILTIGLLVPAHCGWLSEFLLKTQLRVGYYFRYQFPLPVP